MRTPSRTNISPQYLFHLKTTTQKPPGIVWNPPIAGGFALPINYKGSIPRLQYSPLWSIYTTHINYFWWEVECGCPESFHEFLIILDRSPPGPRWNSGCHVGASGEQGKEFPLRSFSGSPTQHFSLPLIGQTASCSCACVAAGEVRRYTPAGAVAIPMKTGLPFVSKERRVDIGWAAHLGCYLKEQWKLQRVELMKINVLWDFPWLT